MAVGDALQGVLMLLVIIALGFLCRKTGLLKPELEAALSKLTLNVSIPALLMINTLENMSPAFLKDMGWQPLIPFATLSGGYLLACLLAKVFRIPENRRGVFAVMFGLSNAVFIGLPICTAVFGEQAVPYVVVYFPANTVVFWTLGNLGIARDGGHKIENPGAIVRKIFSPPFLGFLVGLVLVLTGVELPSFLSSAVRYLSNLTVPVALLTTGATLAGMGKDALKLGREAVLTLAGRLLIMPAVTLTICLLLGTTNEVAWVFTLLASMPVMSQCVIVSRQEGADTPLAAQMLTLSTMATLIWTPLLVFILNIILQ